VPVSQTRSGVGGGPIGQASPNDGVSPGGRLVLTHRSPLRAFAASSATPPLAAGAEINQRVAKCPGEMASLSGRVKSAGTCWHAARRLADVFAARPTRSVGWQ
jgi:hypothetical protein